MQSWMNSGVCGAVLTVVRYLPVLFVSLILSWAYYAYVVELCFVTIEHWGVQRVLYLVFFHILYLLFVASYARTIWEPLAQPPRIFHLPVDVLQEAASASAAAARVVAVSNLDGPVAPFPAHQPESRTTTERLELHENDEAASAVVARYAHAVQLPVAMRSVAQPHGLRWCSRCNCVKPDRAHHCSICGTCILCFDHHCPWINSCVNFANYKFFMLFLGYGLVLCAYAALTDLPYFISFWSGVTGDRGVPAPSRFHVMFLFLVSAMFSISLSFLFFYHLYLISRNQTTLESFRAPLFEDGVNRRAYDMGLKANFRRVFGSRPLYWVLPVSTAHGDGVEWPRKCATMVL